MCLYCQYMKLRLAIYEPRHAASTALIRQADIGGSVLLPKVAESDRRVLPVNAANRVAKLDIGSEAYPEPLWCLCSYSQSGGTAGAAKLLIHPSQLALSLCSFFSGRSVFVRQPRWATASRFWPDSMTSQAVIG